MTLGNLGLLITMLFWGAQVPFLDHLVARFDPLLLSVLRFALALPVLVVLMLWRRERFRLPTSPQRLLLLGAAIATFATSYIVGLSFANPISAAAIVTCAPLVAAIMARLLLQTPLAPGLWLGIGLAVLGGLVVSIDLERGQFGFQGGEFVLLAGMSAWSWYSLMAQRWVVDCSPLRLTLFSVIPALLLLVVLLAVATLLGLSAPVWPDMNALGWGLLLSVSVGAICIGIVLWNFGVSQVGVVVASLYLNLIPLVAVLVSMVFGIYPRLEQLAGGLLVMIGVALGQRRRRSATT